MSTTTTGLAFFREGRTDADYTNIGTSRQWAKSRERIKCADGFDLSVQAGEYLYSTPRVDAGPWTHVEVGFPSDRPEPWAEWSQYVEDEKDPTGTVYAYVPLEMVEALVASHGGEA